MNTKICSTKKFKRGDNVWFCNIEATPSGRFKNIVRPRRVKIKAVSDSEITIDLAVWGIGTRYLIDEEESEPCGYKILLSLGLHIAFSKEESEDKFNNLIKLTVEDRYKNFKSFEYRALRMLI